MSPDAWIILTGICIALPCAWLGSFLMLRKMSMMGDAISHAVLPGIVVAYLISGGRGTLPLLLGAAAGGLLVTFLIQFLNQRAKIFSDASTGISYTLLFAIGVLMIAAYGGQMDIDQDCVLYGEMAYIPFDTIQLASGADLGPRQTYISLGLLIAMGTFIALCFRPLFLTSFDPLYAAAIGVPVILWNYILMGSISLTTVVAFESVGAILVVALMVAPAASAYLLCKRLKPLLILASSLAISAVITGYFLALWWNSSIAACIAVALGFQFILCLIIQGLRAKKKQAQGLL